MSVLSAGLISLVLLGPQARDSQPPPTSIPELESRIRDVLGRTHVPGAGVAVVTRDSILWVAGLGTADVASGRRVTSETLFRIGSTSKAFVSLLVLMLEGEGKLDLNDPVRRYAPEIAFANPWEATDPVRIVHLLEHTTGWDDFALRDYASNDSTPLTLRQGLDLTPRTRTSRWRPGTRVAYCNSGPAVAAYIVQKVEGQPFETLVHERLFVPIGMATATYFPPEPRDRLATLYHSDGRTPFPYWYLSERPAGAINASARDMAAYVRFLLNRGRVGAREIVPPAAIERMERPQSSLGARAGLALGYGLGLATYGADTNLLWVGHDGSVPGGLTMMAYRPDQGVGFAFMLDGESIEAVRRIDGLIRGYLTRDVPRPTLPPPASLSAGAKRWTGWYVLDNPRVQHLYFLERLLAVVRVRMGDDTLTFAPVLGPVRRFVPVSATLFRPAKAPFATLALVTDSLDGRPVAIERVGSLLPGSYRRIPGLEARFQVGATAAFLFASLATVLFATVWVPRWLLGRLRAPSLAARAWPLIATLAAVATATLTGVSGEDAIPRFGAPTAWSLGLYCAILVFAGAAVLGCVTAWRGRDAGRGGVRIYAVAANVLNLLAAAYLARAGMIGWRSWGSGGVSAEISASAGEPDQGGSQRWLAPSVY
ncbi:MAG TPA: serine hydrolase domain-containing protein [Gemmatimonadales bacterium]|nr:serine hydrolase domain-containing protein [Gemmatimonadales bacterium]